MTLRIQRSDARGRVVLTLTGRIQADQVPELRELLRSELSDRRVVLDLREVRLVDRDAVRFLVQSEAEGARLRNCSAFIQKWISQERTGMQHTQMESSDSSRVRG